MSWIDIAIIIVLAVSLVVGLRTGLIKAVLSLAGLVIGIVLAGRFYTLLADKLTFIPQPGIAKAAAFAIIVIVVMVVAGIVAALLKWIASAIMLGWLNHLGGAAFGLVWGALITGAAIAAWIKFLGMADVISDSFMAKILLRYFSLVLALLPAEFGPIRSFF